MPFYAKYPSTNVSVSGVSTVQGDGTAGTPTGGVLTVQGDPAGTPIPITGSISATNPSVAPTPGVVPADATYIGGKNAGNLVPVSVDASGNIVQVGAGVAGTPTGGVVSIQGVGGGTSVPISGSVSVSNFPGTQPVSGTVTVIQPTGSNLHVDVDNFPATVAVTQSTSPWVVSGSGNFTVVQPTGTNLHVVVDSAPTTSVTQGTSPWVVSGTVTANAGTGTFTTDQVVSNATFQNEGSLAFGSITNAYQTVFTAGGNLIWIGLRNNTDAIIEVSLDSGTTNTFFLDPGDYVSLDLKSDGRTIPTAATIQAKYSGSAPTTGNIRVNGYY